MLGWAKKKLGDFWWYSIVLFLAGRVADVMNAFVGLWLVPKCISPGELGAVMPLARFAELLVIPITAFANTFRNEVSRLSIAGEYGRLKTLMRTVFIASGTVLAAAVALSRLAMPLFLERIRMVEGSLGVLILATAFFGAVCPVFGNALQALKKFRASAIIGIAGAPVRLVAMLVFMPFRAVSGYFVGQGATPAFTIVASVFCLKKELSAKAKAYWTRDAAKRFLKLFSIFLAMGVSSGVYSLVEATVIRQRLPDVDSAAYFMVTRFSEISGMLTLTLAFTMFPYTAALAGRPDVSRRLLFKSFAAIALFSLAVAVPFLFCGRTVLSLLPNGDLYCGYHWAIPVMIVVTCVSSFTCLFTVMEISAGRFGYLKWMIPLELVSSAALLLVTGHGYYSHLLPRGAGRFLAAHNIYSLETMLWWIGAITAAKAAFCFASVVRPGMAGGCALESCAPARGGYDR